LAEALAAGGLLQEGRQLAEKAEQVAQSISRNGPPYEQIYVAMAFAALGDTSHSYDIIRRYEEHGDVARGLSRLGQVAAKRGQVHESLLFALEAEQHEQKTIDAENHRCRVAPLHSMSVKAEVAVALAAAGAHEKAEVLLQQLMEGDQEERALFYMGHALVDAGRHDEAHHVSNRLKSGDAKAKVLTHLADALTNDGELARARAFLAEALECGNWISSLVSLARFHRAEEGAQSFIDAAHHLMHGLNMGNYGELGNDPAEDWPTFR
jgi:tetratricopeptide (TPR) repeat protein